METDITFGTRLLNGFLKFMVVVLVGILISVVVGLAIGRRRNSLIKRTHQCPELNCIPIYCFKNLILTARLCPSHVEGFFICVLNKTKPSTEADGFALTNSKYRKMTFLYL